jgi:hypothetical protein
MVSLTSTIVRRCRLADQRAIAAASMLGVISTVTHAGLGLTRTTAELNANDACTQPN